MSRFLISAAHKSSGKTTLTIGLGAALAGRGYHVQVYKKGPDYIDPLWHSKATGHPCYNLDFNTMQPQEIATLWRRHAMAADATILEGNKGLHDGMDVAGGDSNAALARLLDIPVLLVVDVAGITRGVVPLLLGYQQFEPDVRIAGIILNKVASPRHEGKLRAAIEHYMDLPVFGAVHRDPRLVIHERHLGLVPSNEQQDALDKITQIRDCIEQQVDMGAIVGYFGISRQPEPAAAAINDTAAAKDLKIGIAQDAAFGFYYPDDLEALQAGGAELVPINTIRDTQLPDIDALFIGGGFPETQMQALSANAGLREQIRNAIERGLPVYAECGGLMYLCRQISWQGETCDMVGALPADVIMHPRPQGRGIVRLRDNGNGPWPPEEGWQGPLEIAAHEFHHSSLDNIAPGVEFAYDVIRGSGIDGAHDGLVYRNVLANYAHLRDVAGHHWTRRFLSFVRARRDSKSG